MSETLPYPSALDALPPPWKEDVLPEIRRKLVESGKKVFVLDDDPTGTQTVRDLYVVTDWEVETLARQFDRPEPGCFVLTNSRALNEEETGNLHRELATKLETAAAGRPFTLVSRSDSTLRGHFPLETDTLAEVLGGFDLVVLAPYFGAGGRLTLHGEHYVAEDDQLVPAARTPFARDPAFSYSHSFLPAYVEEKTGGRIKAGSVRVLDIELIRQGGPEVVCRELRNASAPTVFTVDACCDRDIEVFAAGAVKAESAGRRILYRSAAGLVAARLGQSVPPVLQGGELHAGGPSGGLVVVGSYVPKTTAQLETLRTDERLEFLELDVQRVLEADSAAEYLMEVESELLIRIFGGRHTVLHTSRRYVSGSSAASSLRIGQKVSNALVRLVTGLGVRPRFLVAKGGITSSDIATRALAVREARVLGQVHPGVPVWETGPESRFPGLPYVVFPGNVGGPDALLQVILKLLD